jgi:hypothetical protein
LSGANSIIRHLSFVNRHSPCDSISVFNTSYTLTKLLKLTHSSTA